MEVYKITNKVNGKVYIGSTIHTKESRWGTDANASGSSHIACMKRGIDRPLYSDMRSMGLDQFELDTLVEVKETTESVLRDIEEYYIHHYIDKLGRDNVYNMSEHSRGTDCSQMRTPEVLDKIIKKYGSLIGPTLTEEAESKRRDTCIERYGTRAGLMNTRESRVKRSNLYEYKGSQYLLSELHSVLVNDGYELSYDQLKKFLNKGILSKRNQSRYPELLSSIAKVEK